MECDESLRISTSSTAAIMQSSNVSDLPTRAIVRQAFAVWLATHVVLAVDLLVALPLARGLVVDNAPDGDTTAARRDTQGRPCDGIPGAPPSRIRETAIASAALDTINLLVLDACSFRGMWGRCPRRRRTSAPLHCCAPRL